MCDNLNKIITIKELIKLLNIGENTAYKLLESGGVRGFILGNEWKISIKSVNSYIIKMTDDTK